MAISVSSNTQSRAFRTIRRPLTAQPAIEILGRNDDPTSAEEVNGFGFERRRAREYRKSAYAGSTAGDRLPQLRVLAQLAREEAGPIEGYAAERMTATYDRANDVTGRVGHAQFRVAA